MEVEKLKEYGIDYERGLRSCMGNEAFYTKILSMFLKDECFARARAAHAAGDYSVLFTCMHELKGVSGNAGLTALYDACVPLVELLRRDADNHEQIESRFHEAETAYTSACEGIAVIISEGQA